VSERQVRTLARRGLLKACRLVAVSGRVGQYRFTQTAVADYLGGAWTPKRQPERITEAQAERMHKLATADLVRRGWIKAARRRAG
jgi:hypothetical protein